jgi:hypothetical protein
VYGLFFFCLVHNHFMSFSNLVGEEGPRIHT